MSDATLLLILAVEPAHVADYLQCSDRNDRKGDALVAGRAVGASRGGWYQAAIRELISDAGLGESLRFVSNERAALTRVTGDEAVDFAVTGNFREVRTPEDRKAWGERRRWGYRRNYTVVVPADLPALSADVESLWRFCVDNIEAHPLLNDGSYDSAEELLAGLRLFKNLGDCGYGDEGDNSGFYFFALHALRSLLADAMNNGWAIIYLNEDYVAVVEDDPAGARR